MTRNQALEFIEHYPDAKNYIKESHLENLSPLVEVAIEAVSCKKEDFHALPANTYMPRKETLDRFAMAAGVSFNPLEESTRKEGDCYIGRSQAMIMGPDGKYCYGDVCEYEYDTKVRHEEEIITDRNSRTPKLHLGNKLLEDRARLAYLSLRKAARQRANTGARCRAILSILGMQTGFKDLFRPDDLASKEIIFLFSHIIINTKNEMVLHRMLDSLTAPARMLYGNEARITETNDEYKGYLPKFSSVGNYAKEQNQPKKDRTGENEGLEEIKEKPPYIKTSIGSIKDCLESGLLGQRGTLAAKDALENHCNDEEFLKDIAARLEAACERRKSMQ